MDVEKLKAGIVTAKAAKVPEPIESMAKVIAGLDEETGGLTMATAVEELEALAEAKKVGNWTHHIVERIERRTACVKEWIVNKAIKEFKERKNGK
jgi:hypothetical protein